jgi:WD40 repeat protein
MLAFDPTGRWLVAADCACLAHDKAGGVSIIDVAGQREVTRIARGQPVMSIDIDATRLAIAAKREAIVLDTGTWMQHAVLAGSRGKATALALIPDGRIAMATDDATVAIWDNDGHLLATLPGSGDEGSLAVSHDSHMLAVGTDDGAVTIWDLATYRALVRRQGHHLATTFVAFAPDDSRVFTGGRDGRVASWPLDRAPRALGELDRLIRCRVPLQLAGEAVLPRELDFEDPSCRGL